MKLYKKGLNDPDNHDDAVTHLEPDTPKCEVNFLVYVLLKQAQVGLRKHTWTKLAEMMKFQLNCLKS